MCNLLCAFKIYLPFSFCIIVSSQRRSFAAFLLWFLCFAALFIHLCIIFLRLTEIFFFGAFGLEIVVFFDGFGFALAY